MKLAVNGTLMRGLKLNPNLQAVDAQFLYESATAPSYRLWTIDDEHPAMQRVSAGGASIALEVWEVPASGIAEVLSAEPAGLCIGKVTLVDGEEVVGVLGEAVLGEKRTEIAEFGVLASRPVPVNILGCRSIQFWCPPQKGKSID